MELIDENGNLFGVVNVIDALVVLVLVAVVVAGVAFVTMGGDAGDDTGSGGDAGHEPDSSTEPATQYVTLDLGDQPDYVLERLETGDTGSVGNANAMVTDIEHPSATNHSAVTIRAELEGTTLEDDGDTTFEVAGEPLRLGRQLELDMDLYTTNGTITDIGDDPSLASAVTTTTVDVELRNVDPTVADSLENGATATERGESIATVDALERDSAIVVVQSDDGELHEREHPRNEDLTLTVELETVETADGTYYRGTPIGVGQRIVLEFDRLTVEGTVSGLE